MYPYYYRVYRPKNLLLMVVPKVAWRSLQRWLIRVVGYEPNPPGPLCDPPGECRRYGLRALMEDLTDPGLYKVCFVRNPYRRLVSGFVEKFACKPTFRKDSRIFLHRAMQIMREVQEGRGEKYDRWHGITFRGFVNYLTRMNPADMNEHWKPQSIFMQGVSFDYVGQFEKLNEGLLEVCNRVGIENPPELEHLGKTEYRESGECAADTLPYLFRTSEKEIPKWSDFYDGDLKQKVFSMYHDDFEIKTTYGDMWTWGLNL